MKKTKHPSASAIAASDSALTPAQFHILLTLAEGDRHGYGIMQEISRRTEGGMELGPGTLYRSIKQLSARGLICEADSEGYVGDRATASDDRRRSYSLTRAGRIRAVEEARRLKLLVRWAEDAMILGLGRP